MQRRFVSTFAASACAALALAACSTPSAPIPVQNGGTNSATTHHLYVVANTNLEEFTLPVTAASTPIATTTVAGTPGGMTASATQLFVADQSNRSIVDVFALPLTANATPSFTIAVPTAPTDAKLDRSGNLWVSSSSSPTCCVYEYTAPLSASSTPALTLNQPDGAGYPWGLAFDASGDLYLAGASVNDKYTAPLTSSSTPITFGTNNDNYGINVDSTGRVFVANATADGEIDVFNPSPTNASAPAFTLTPAAGGYVGYPAFDSAGNFYVPTGTNIYVYTAPISSSSVPAFAMPVSGAYSALAGL